MRNAARTCRHDTTAGPTIVDTLQRAASRTALAPSVHNTQPWHLVVTSDWLEIHSEALRRLREALGADLHPRILLRVGHAPNTVPSRRVEAADVISLTF
jgi:nitroreductase